MLAANMIECEIGGDGQEGAQTRSAKRQKIDQYTYLTRGINLVSNPRVKPGTTHAKQTRCRVCSQPTTQLCSRCFAFDPVSNPAFCAPTTGRTCWFEHVCAMHPEH